MPRAWPIEPATEGARAPRPASRIKQATAGLLARGSFACRRLPRAHPSGQLRQAFRLQLRGQLRNSGENPSPHSLFTPHLRGDRQFSLTKGLGRRACQRRRPSPADRACGDQTPVYSSDRRRFPHATCGTQDGNAVKSESFKAAAAPATVSGELPFIRSHWSHLLREGGRDAETRKPVDRPVTSNLNRPRVEGRGDNMTTLSTKRPGATDSAAELTAARAGPLVMAALLGIFIVGGVGFSHIEAVHNAAHDYRHSMAFPCH